MKMRSQIAWKKENDLTGTKIRLVSTHIFPDDDQVYI